MRWDPAQYLRFSRERTQPSRDLAARIEVASPRAVLDLGCGPGNSTRVLAERFPGARVVGGDVSDDMLVRARADQPGLEFVHLDATEDLSAYDQAFDVVFSNACLQWVPNHQELIPRLMRMLAPGGQLAVQVPLMDQQVMYAQVIYPLVRSPRWAGILGEPVRTHVLEPRAYLPILASCTSDYAVWQTNYWHRMPSHEAVLDWYRGSGLRPYLQQLDEGDQEALLADVLAAVRDAFPTESTGEVILEFPRLFWLATAPSV